MIAGATSTSPDDWTSGFNIAFPIVLDIACSIYAMLSDVKARRQFAAAVQQYTASTRLDALLYGAFDEAEVENMITSQTSTKPNSTPHWILSHNYFRNFELIAGGSYGRVYVAILRIGIVTITAMLIFRYACA